MRYFRILTDSKSLISFSNCLFCSFIFIIILNTDCLGCNVRSNWWYMFLQNLYDKKKHKTVNKLCLSKIEYKYFNNVNLLKIERDCIWLQNRNCLRFGTVQRI